MERFERTPLICAKRRAVSQRNARSSSSQLWALPVPTPKDLQETLEKHYDGCQFVTVGSAEDVDNIALLMPEELNDTNELRLMSSGTKNADRLFWLASWTTLAKALQDKQFRT